VHTKIDNFIHSFIHSQKMLGTLGDKSTRTRCLQYDVVSGVRRGVRARENWHENDEIPFCAASLFCRQTGTTIDDENEYD